MSTRTTRYVTLPSFVVDPRSVMRASGRQVDWAAITVSDTDYLDDNSDKAIKPGTVVSQKGGKVLPRALAAVAVTSAVSASNVVTVTATAHGLATGEYVRVSGSSDPEADGIYQVTVTDANTFTYTAAGAVTDGAVTGQTIVAAAVGMLEANAVEQDDSHASTGYGVMIGGVFYENLLPDATGAPAVLPADYKTELAATGYAYAYEAYGDSRTA